MPKISVIMPVYNQNPSYLREAIESILGQTFHDFELIIIDDGTTEKECLNIIEHYAATDRRIHVSKNIKNSGIIISLNRAIDLSSGEYIARMDSDDIAYPKRLEKQLHFLERHPSCDLLGTLATVIDENSEKIGNIKLPTTPRDIRSTILKRNPLIHPTWMFRSSLTEKVGKYSQDTTGTEDYEFLLRIATTHEIHNLPEPLLKYRFNVNGISFGKNKLQEKSALAVRMKALKKYGYSRWEAIYLVAPIFFYLFVPSYLKKILLRVYFKTI